MKLMITGGAGFIGSNFIFYERKKHPEHEIICLDKLTYAGNLATLASVVDQPNFKFVRGDIADREAVFELFQAEKPDVKQESPEARKVRRAKAKAAYAEQAKPPEVPAAQTLDIRS